MMILNSKRGDEDTKKKKCLIGSASVGNGIDGRGRGRVSGSGRK